jgi:hypothetical protein
MSAPKHVLLRVWSNGAPSRFTVVWKLEQWHAQRGSTMRWNNLTLEEADARHVIKIGGKKRLLALQKTLERLEHA